MIVNNAINRLQDAKNKKKIYAKNVKKIICLVREVHVIKKFKVANNKLEMFV